MHATCVCYVQLTQSPDVRVSIKKYSLFVYLAQILADMPLCHIALVLIWNGECIQTTSDQQCSTASITHRCRCTAIFNPSHWLVFGAMLKISIHDFYAFYSIF